MSKYWYNHCPNGVKSRFELLVFNCHDQPFLPLTEYYHDCIGRISNSSAISYIQSLLSFFTWLDQYSNYQGKHVKWDDSPDRIRKVVEDYLMSEMSCKIREKDTFRFVNRTSKSPNTVNRFLAALKSFYKSLIHLNLYLYSNPLIDSQAVLNSYKRGTEGVRKDKPRMPSEAGTEDAIHHRRLTDSYFKLINEEWKPEIIGDIYLPYQVYGAGKRVNWSLREILIARLLFETGARASEVIELTIGDYRTRKSFQEASTFNKGSYGKRVKFIRFSKDTVKLLMRYINTERKKIDDLNRNFDMLPDESRIFLTECGNPFSYSSWYYHWNKAMKECGIKLNPHKTRHWFITSRLREIFNTSISEAEIKQKKNELIKYIKWKDDETINVYEHYFDEENHRKVHDGMLESMVQQEKDYMKQRNTTNKKERNLTIYKSINENAIDNEILELLDGLE